MESLSKWTFSITGGFEAPVKADTRYPFALGIISSTLADFFKTTLWLQR